MNDNDRDQDRPVAYVDKLTLCQGNQCGAGARGHCDPSLWVFGHCSDGSDVAFLIILRDDEGHIISHTDPLLSQRGNGVLITSEKNDGPPWLFCDYHIPTRGAGGYSLSQLLGIASLHRSPSVTWTIQAVASPVSWTMTPDGRPLWRLCTHEWNWDAALEAPLHIFLQNRLYRCDEVSVGDFPNVNAPIISDIKVAITGDDGDKGYADATVTFETDIPSLCEIHYNLGQSTTDIPQKCDPFGPWQTAETPIGTSHTIDLSSSALYYDTGAHKTYCFIVIARNALYPHVTSAIGYSETQEFILPHNTGQE